MNAHDSKATDMAGEPSNAEILQAVQKVSESQTALQTKVEKIETALYGTGNPHGGLFQQFAALEGKVSTLSTEIKGVEKTLTAKIDGVNEKFDKMFSFAKWAIAILAVPIFFEVILPMLRRWTENF